MKKNIAIINTKGGVGKSTLSFHILPYLLRNKEFQIIEIDDNNDTSLSFSNSGLLKEIVSCDISQGTQKLEELVIENMLNEEKITIIDSGGGNDSKAVISSLISQNLAKDTLFIIPYFADFSQLKNLFESVELVKDFDFLVCLNNYTPGSKEDEMFKTGNEDYQIPNIEKIFKKHFCIVYKTNLFSFSSSMMKQSIYDFAKIAFDFDQNQILQHAKQVTNSDKDQMVQMYRDWKIADKAKEYLLSLDININLEE